VIRTVDLVIAGGGKAALAAATDALQRGRRILVVLGGGAEERRRFRRDLSKARNGDGGHVTLITDADVVCVDGVGGVEAVVIRYARTGRLCAVNTSRFLSCDAAEPLMIELVRGSLRPATGNHILNVPQR
jgi:hypothetical protein